MSLTLMYITNNLDVALIAQKYGVDRIWIDLETLDKEERQKGINSVKSHHSIRDIKKIRPFINTSKILVRINHWYDNSINEIENVIEAGADIIMLPYWKTVDEVSKFIDTVDGRCKTTLLLETKEAVECIDDVLSKRKIDEIHIGLNDLHLSYGKTFMFELLADGTVEKLCKKFENAGIPYGFGGIAKLGDGMLSAEKVIMEHYRLGSTRAILSRTFCDTSIIDNIDEVEKIFRENMSNLRMYEKSIMNLKLDDFIKNQMDVKETVRIIVANIKKSCKI